MKIRNCTSCIAPTRTGKYAFFIAAIALQACGSYPEQGSEAVGTAKEDLYGMPSAGNTYWNGSPVGTVSGVGAAVPVCWTLSATQGKVDPLATDGNGNADPFRGQLVSKKDPTKTYPTFQQIKAWVQEGVEDSWGRVSGLSFTGWNTTCASNGSGDDKPSNPGKLMIALDSGADYTDGDSQGRSTSHGSKVYFNATKTTQGSYVAYAIHEFGHALGFDHEKARPDNWSGGVAQVCKNSGEKGPAAGGDYLSPQGQVDVNSIMCYDNRPNHLSARDVMGVQRLYGMKPAGSFVGYGGRCAQFQGGSVTAGTPVISSTCGSSWTSFWLSWFSQITVTPDNGASRVSWNISGGTVSNSSPTPLIAWPFGNFANQMFPLTGMRWKALGNMCVAVSTAKADQQLLIQACDAVKGGPELWDFWTSGTAVQLSGTNLCVTEPQSPAALGDPLKLERCSGAATQNFNFATAYQMRDGASSLCANVLGGSPDGGNLGMWNGCDFAPGYQNEQFHMTGHVVGLGQCAVWSNDALADGTAAQVRACAPAPGGQAVGDGTTWVPTDTQDWDVYWP